MMQNCKNFKSLFLFILFWLIPVTCIGILKIKPFFIPSSLFYIYTVSGLFTQRQPVWDIYYLRLVFSDSSETFDEEKFFPMQPFGRLSRLQFYLDRYSGENAVAFRNELAQWIRKKYGTITSKPIIRIEFYQCRYYVDQQILGKNGWEKPTFESYRQEDVKLLGAVNF